MDSIGRPEAQTQLPSTSFINIILPTAGDLQEAPRRAPTSRFAAMLSPTPRTLPGDAADPLATPGDVATLAAALSGIPSPRSAQASSASAEPKDEFIALATVLHHAVTVGSSADLLPAATPSLSRAVSNAATALLEALGEVFGGGGGSGGGPTSPSRPLERQTSRRSPITLTLAMPRQGSRPLPPSALLIPTASRGPASASPSTLLSSAGPTPIPQALATALSALFGDAILPSPAVAALPQSSTDVWSGPSLFIPSQVSWRPAAIACPDGKASELSAAVGAWSWGVWMGRYVCKWVIGGCVDLSLM